MENENKTFNTIKVSIPKPLKASLSISCTICTEMTPLTDYEESMIRHGNMMPIKICDKCKKAILYMRSQMPEE